MASLFPAACDAEQDCPAGHETCVCAEDYQCLEGLECLSNRCVGPAGNTGNAGGTSSDPSGDGNGNNVSACEDFVDNLDCALPGGPATLDCSLYEGVDCDLAPYLDCLSDNTTCADGMADLTGWAECASVATDCA